MTFNDIYTAHNIAITMRGDNCPIDVKMAKVRE
jgi:hypothetical protein